MSSNRIVFCLPAFLKNPYLIYWFKTKGFKLTLDFFEEAGDDNDYKLLEASNNFYFSFTILSSVFGLKVFKINYFKKTFTIF